MAEPRPSTITAGDATAEVDSIDEERATGRFGGRLELLEPGSTIESGVLGGDRPPATEVEGRFDVPVRLSVEVA